jgi:hypothetical protein
MCPVVDRLETYELPGLGQDWEEKDKPTQRCEPD